MTTTNIKPLSPEWHERRRSSITGTDVPAILGASDYAGPYEVWARITGRIEPSTESNAYMRWGNATEAANREELSREYRLEVTDSTGLCVDDERDWLVATNDGLVATSERPDLGVWEGKSPSRWTADQWADGRCPRAYQVQTQVNMRVMGLDWGIISAFIPPNGPGDELLRVRHVERNEDFQRAMIDEIDRFWHEYVLTDTPPPATAKDLGVLKALHAQDNGSARFLDAEIEQAWKLRQVAKSAISEYQEAVREQDAKIIQALGEHAYGVLPDGQVISYGTVERKGYTVEPTTYRSLSKRKALPAGVAMSEGGAA